MNIWEGVGRITIFGLLMFLFFAVLSFFAEISGQTYDWLSGIGLALTAASVSVAISAGLVKYFASLYEEVTS